VYSVGIFIHLMKAYDPLNLNHKEGNSWLGMVVR
jgi:hypothetical protein